MKFMNSDNAKTVAVNIMCSGFCDLLGLLFIALKLTNMIDWSWWYVLMPLYLPPTIIALIIGIVLFVSIIIIAGVLLYDLFNWLVKYLENKK